MHVENDAPPPGDAGDLLFQIHMFHIINRMSQKPFPEPPKFVRRVGGEELQPRSRPAFVRVRSRNQIP